MLPQSRPQCGRMEQEPIDATRADSLRSDAPIGADWAGANGREDATSCL